MTGQELFEMIISNPKYEYLYENNLYFSGQLQYIKNKEKVSISTLLGSIAFLSKLLMQQDLERIRRGDEGLGRYNETR